MPTYEYRCQNGHDSEQFYRKISDALAELPCPVCGTTAARRVSGGAGLVFKGSGFYLTDYGKNAHRKSGGDGAKPDGKADGKIDGKAETAKVDAAASSGGDGAASKPAKSESAKSETTTSSSKGKSGDSQ